MVKDQGGNEVLPALGSDFANKIKGRQFLLFRVGTP